MKILAIILARKGSKRLPNKNRLLLGGKPLFEWSINSSKKVNNICDILVSTDDEKIIEFCRKKDVLIPWKRPKELAKDTSSSVDACIHALDWYEDNVSKVNGVILLQPTSPFRTHKTIEKGISLFKNNQDTTIVSVSKAKKKLEWMFQFNENLFLKPLIEKKLNDGFKSQETYVLNGALYIISPQKLRNDKSFFGGKLKPIVMRSDVESIDIDTLLDFELAKIVINNKMNDK